jgi:hypothetical protein
MRTPRGLLPSRTARKGMTPAAELTHCRSLRSAPVAFQAHSCVYLGVGRDPSSDTPRPLISLRKSSFPYCLEHGDCHREAATSGPSPVSGLRRDPGTVWADDLHLSLRRIDLRPVRAEKATEAYLKPLRPSHPPLLAHPVVQLAGRAVSRLPRPVSKTRPKLGLRLPLFWRLSSCPSRLASQPVAFSVADAGDQSWSAANALAT